MDETERYESNLNLLENKAERQWGRLYNYIRDNNLSEKDFTPYSKLYWELIDLGILIKDSKNCNANDAVLENIEQQINVLRKKISDLIGMDGIEIYHYLIQQEVLKECACDDFNRLVNYMCTNNLSEDDDTPYAKLFWEMAKFHKKIISDANNDDIILDGIRETMKKHRNRLNKLTAE